MTVRRGMPFQIFRGNVENNPLVRYIRIQLRPVDAMGIQQHDIPGLQQVPLSVRIIAAAALEQQQDLAEGMVVVLHLGAASGFQMKQPEIFQEISPFHVFGHKWFLHSMNCNNYSTERVLFAIPVLYNDDRNCKQGESL